MQLWTPICKCLCLALILLDITHAHHIPTPRSSLDLRPAVRSVGLPGGVNSKGLNAQLLSEIGNDILTSQHALLVTHIPKQVGNTPHPTSSHGWLTSLATMCNSYPMATTDSYFHLLLFHLIIFQDKGPCHSVRTNKSRSPVQFVRYISDLSFEGFI